MDTVVYIKPEQTEPIYSECTCEDVEEEDDHRDTPGVRMAPVSTWSSTRVRSLRDKSDIFKSKSESHATMRSIFKWMYGVLTMVSCLISFASIYFTSNMEGEHKKYFDVTERLSVGLIMFILLLVNPGSLSTKHAYANVEYKKLCTELDSELLKSPLVRKSFDSLIQYVKHKQDKISEMLV